MEVYPLDPLLRRVEVIDRFESLIWTERFAAFGDFELKIRSTRETRALLQPGTKLAMNESFRVMTVETFEDGMSEDGKRILTVSGNSLEATLEDRVAKAALAGTATWDITGTPAVVARKIFHDICVTGVLDPLDQIEFVVEAPAPFVPYTVASNIAEPVDPITVNLPIKSVYEAIKDICEVWTLGFRLLRNYDASQLYWEIYSGSNRTSGQTTRPPVIFSPELDNLTDTKEFKSTESSKNVAYVFAPNGYRVVYPNDVDPQSAGLERRVLYVQADDITLPAGPALDVALLQRGKEELAKSRPFQGFDGEINQRSQYKYQRDYFLGDLVEQRNAEGVANLMRVTEQIFVSDKEGERNYPTLALNQFVNTGSWLAEGLKTWADYNAETTTWSEKP